MQLVKLLLLTIVLSGCSGHHFHVHSDWFDPKPIADMMLEVDQNLPYITNGKTVRVEADASVHTTRSGFVRRGYNFSKEYRP